jgi:hypothetical protein
MGGPPPGGLKSRVRRWFADLGFRQMRQAMVVVILAATALFGGLDSVETKVTHFRPGEKFSDGEFTLSVDRASLVRELRAGETQLPPKPGRRYLGVVADVRNDGTVPGKLEGELNLRGEANTRFIGASRMKDGTLVDRLGPGLSDQLAFFWEVPDTAVKPGESVTFRVWQKQFQELRVTYGKTWLDSLTDYGQIEVPVKVIP